MCWADAVHRASNALLLSRHVLQLCQLLAASSLEVEVGGAGRLADGAQVVAFVPLGPHLINGVEPEICFDRLTK